MRRTREYVATTRDEGNAVDDRFSATRQEGEEMLHEIQMPQAGFSITEGTIVGWSKKIGERVQKDETIVVVETDKVTVEIPAQVAGVLVEVRFEKGETAPVGSVLGVIADEGDAEAMAAMSSVGKGAVGVARPAEIEREAVPARALAVAAGGTASSSASVRRFVSPVARKIAAEEGLDLSRIETGSGPGGRIVKQDVLRLAKAPKPASVQAPPAAKPAEAPEKVKFVGWRKVIADRMISSAREVPQGEPSSRSM